MVEVQTVVRELRALLDSGADSGLVAASVGWLNEFAGTLLGLLPDTDAVRAAQAKGESMRSNLASQVESLLSERDSAREAKDWPRADEIREELSAIGVIVEDGPEGPTWRLE